jgi:hypothetical protein
MRITGFVIALTVMLLFALLAHPVYPIAPPLACIHGMRIVGEQSIYLSHMGLFHNTCHEYQGLFEVSFEGPDNPQKLYLEAQKRDPNQNEFTIEPTETFVLSELGTGKLKSFQANLYSGQYERSATESALLAENITIKVKRVLHFRQFKSGAKQPTKLEYLLFGNKAEPLAAHLITAPPDFDQIVGVKTPVPVTPTAVRLVLPNRLTPNTVSNLRLALKPSDQSVAQVNGQGPKQSIVAKSQYFLETDDYQ